MTVQAQPGMQPSVESALKNDVRSGRFTHALLLSGQKGLGKKTLARQLAKGLLCTGNPAERPCGLCASCRRFESGTHANLLTPVRKPSDKSIKIDAIRDILKALSMHGLERGARVVLLENAEMLLPPAQNCLLKTLEEADGDTYFILTTDSERSILPTILSRCRIERMQPWPDERMADELRRAGIPGEKIRELIAVSDGSIGQALSIAQNAAYWDARDAVVKGLLSVSSPGDVPAALSRFKEKKDDAGIYLDIAEQELSAFLQAVAAGAPPASYPSPAWRYAALPGLRRMLAAVFTARRMRASNVNWQAALEQLLQTIVEETSAWQP